MSTAPTVPSQLKAAITNLVMAVDEALGDDFSQPARLLMFEPDADGLTFGVKELAAGQHPLEELMGFVAPESWAALGAVAHGWASRDVTTRPSRAGDRVRVRSIHVIARDDSDVGGYRVDGSPFDLVAESPIGMVPDALHRCLDLPTPAADFPAAELSAADWLDAIADDTTALQAPPRPYTDWDQVRWEVITRARVVPDLTPTLATWMDAGIFARWISGTYPRTADHLASVRRLITPAQYQSVRETVLAWGLTD